MALTETQKYMQALRTPPTIATEGTKNLERASRYGEGYVIPYSPRVAAMDGQYFVATNATRGTGLAGHAAPTDITLDTKAHVFIRNTHATKQLILDFIRLQVTAAGAGATTAVWATELDQDTTRYSSGGTLLTSRNVNQNSSEAASATIYSGAVTAAAASASRRNLESGVLRTVVPVVGDTYLWKFGADQGLSSMIVGGTAIANIVVAHVPVVLEENDQFLLHLAGASQSGAHSYEVAIGFIQR